MISTEFNRKIHPLEAVPVRSEGIREFKERDDGRLLLLPLKPSGKFRQWLSRFLGKEELRLVLDERGAQFWETVDGQRSLREVVKILMNKFGVSEKVCTEACVRYCADLVQRGFLHLSIPKGGQ